ncbi:MAG: polymerase sigma factor, sigma-70 family [Gemmatimonadetes bacterium]|nr:polymerase sigma factor, sigma-70 family [Gemmatimonadota bacterium]
MPERDGSVRLPDVYSPSKSRLPRPDLEALFLAHLPAAEKILSGLARRHALSRDAAEEFAAWAKMRLIEDDYAILGKFRGDSSLPTYLTVVIAMLYREYRVQEWGRWRPSAAARRGGNLAVKLELLTQRDRIPLSHAGEMLRTSGETRLSDRELGAMVAEFPGRTPLRPVQSGHVAPDVPAQSRADEAVDEAEHLTASHNAQRMLASALDSLPPEDRLIVRLHYMKDLSVADIARGLSLPQKPLYRRLDRALRTLRSRLEHSGLSSDTVRSLTLETP